jgi:D-alanyl-D-alanine carboxypeptidase/D-alanyl-D-alanine-endopeptidase (penicillin-binding protein 4)
MTLLLLPFLAPSLAIDQIVNDPILDGAVAAVCILKADGTPVYEHESTRRVMPASNMKLITTTFALHNLGPNFHSKTRFWKGLGALTIDATSEPGLTAADWKKVATQLGAPFDVVRIHQAISAQPHPDWETSDLPNAYAAPISSLTMDKGIFELRSSADGTLAAIPSELGISVAYSNGSQALKWTYDLATDKILASGKVPATDSQLERFALRRPDLAVARCFGKVVVPATFLPTNPPDFTLDGPAMIDNIKTCLVESNNLYAENLMLTGAGVTASDANPWDKAVPQVTSFLTDVVKWPGPGPKVADGSGLSRHNLVTSSGIAHLLMWARTQSWFDQFYASLARPGIGTLRSRLAGTSFVGKTGTLSQVTALSGYVHAKDGTDYIASVIINNSLANTQKQQALIDKIIVTLEAGEFRAPAVAYHRHP